MTEQRNEAAALFRQWLSLHAMASTAKGATQEQRTAYREQGVIEDRLHDEFGVVIGWDPVSRQFQLERQAP